VCFILYEILLSPAPPTWLHLRLQYVTAPPPAPGFCTYQSAVEEPSGAALVAGGMNEIKQKLKKLDRGVLFLDEAYQLDPARDPSELR